MCTVRARQVGQQEQEQEQNQGQAQEQEQERFFEALCCFGSAPALDAMAGR